MVVSRVLPWAKIYKIIGLVLLMGLGLIIAWQPLKTVVVFLAGIIFLPYLLHRPILALYALIPAIPFSPFLSVSISGASIGAMEMILFAGLAAWGLQILVYRNSIILNPTAKLLLIPFLIFFSGIGLSWLNTLSVGTSLIETIKWIEIFALYLFVTALLPPDQIKWVIGAILLTGVAQAMLGLYQFIFKIGPEGFLLFDGLFLRAYGTFAQPNPYAGYLGLILPLALTIFIWVFKTQTISTDLRSLILVGVSVTFGILLAALFASQSRGGWLGFLIAVAVMAMVRSKKITMGFIGLLAASALIALAGTFSQITMPELQTAYGVILQRLADAATTITMSDVSNLEVTSANFAILERLAHWQAAREMWRDNLWLGVGFGNYAVVYPAYAVGRWFDPLGHAHNYFLNLGAEIGLIGLMGYLFFWLLVLRKLWSAIIKEHYTFYQAIIMGGLGVITHLHVHNFFDNLYVQGMYLHIAIILALISIICHHQRKTNTGES